MGLTVQEVWRHSQCLIGPQARLRLETGGRLRVLEEAPVSVTGRDRPDGQLYEFEMRSTGRAEQVAVYGRHAEASDWLMVDGPWRRPSIASNGGIPPQEDS